MFGLRAGVGATRWSASRAALPCPTLSVSCFDCTLVPPSLCQPSRFVPSGETARGVARLSRAAPCPQRRRTGRLDRWSELALTGQSLALQLAKRRVDRGARMFMHISDFLSFVATGPEISGRGGDLRSGAQDRIDSPGYRQVILRALEQCERRGFLEARPRLLRGTGCFPGAVSTHGLRGLASYALARSSG